MSQLGVMITRGGTVGPGTIRSSSRSSTRPRRDGFRAIVRGRKHFLNRWRNMGAFFPMRSRGEQKCSTLANPGANTTRSVQAVLFGNLFLIAQARVTVGPKGGGA